MGSYIYIFNYRNRWNLTFHYNLNRTNRFMLSILGDKEVPVLPLPLVVSVPEQVCLPGTLRQWQVMSMKTAFFEGKTHLHYQDHQFSVQGAAGEVATHQPQTKVS